MDANIKNLTDVDRKGLLILWDEVFSGKPPKHMSVSFMRHILAFEIQSRAQGGISKLARNKLERLQADKARPQSSHLKVGSRLLREWNGVTHVVEVMEGAFLWREDQYRSLSAVARAITGAHWSGPRFFGLTREVQR